MVEKDAVRGKESVGVSIVADDVIGVNLGGCIGALRLEGGRLTLGGRRRTEHFTGGGLVETGFDPRLPYCLEEADRSETGHVAGVLRHVEAHPDMALGAEVVDFVRPGLLKEVGELS
jgi:hypothetical protein